MGQVFIELDPSSLQEWAPILGHKHPWDPIQRIKAEDKQHTTIPREPVTQPLPAEPTTPQLWITTPPAAPEQANKLLPSQDKPRDGIQEGQDKVQALPRMGEDHSRSPKRDGNSFGIACYASSAIRKGDRSEELRRNTCFTLRLRTYQKEDYHLPLEAWAHRGILNPKRRIRDHNKLLRLGTSVSFARYSTWQKMDPDRSLNCLMRLLRRTLNILVHLANWPR